MFNAETQKCRKHRKNHSNCKFYVPLDVDLSQCLSLQLASHARVWRIRTETCSGTKWPPRNRLHLRLHVQHIQENIQVWYIPHPIESSGCIIYTLWKIRRSFPTYEYKVLEHAHKGPFSKTVTMTHPLNPFNKVEHQLRIYWRWPCSESLRHWGTLHIVILLVQN